MDGLERRPDLSVFGSLAQRVRTFTVPLLEGLQPFPEEWLFLISLRSKDSEEEAETGWLRTCPPGHCGVIERRQSGACGACGSMLSFTHRQAPVPLMLQSQPTPLRYELC